MCHLVRDTVDNHLFTGMQASPLVGQWFDARLPVHLRTTMNSAVYVPLLLDAAGLLSLDAVTAWRQISTQLGWQC